MCHFLMILDWLDPKNKQTNKEKNTSRFKQFGFWAFFSCLCSPSCSEMYLKFANDQQVSNPPLHIDTLGMLANIHNVAIQTLYPLRTKSGQMKAIFLTCFNLNKVRAHTCMWANTNTYMYTNTFLSSLGKPLSFFLLYSVQIASWWDKSIMFPETPHTVLHSFGLMFSLTFSSDPLLFCSPSKRTFLFH